MVLMAKLYVHLSMCLTSFTPAHLTNDRCHFSNYSKYSGNLFHYQVTYGMATFLNSFMPQQVSTIIYHPHHLHHPYSHLYVGYLQLYT